MSDAVVEARIIVGGYIYVYIYICICIYLDTALYLSLSKT